MKKVYVLSLHDSVHSGMHRELIALGGSVVIADANGSFSSAEHDHSHEIVAVMFSGRKEAFPGRHLRCLPSLEAANNKSFAVSPAFIPYLEGREVTALILLLEDMTFPVQMTREQRLALQNFHHRSRDGRWHGPKADSKPKANRLEKRRAERREERREHYGFVR